MACVSRVRVCAREKRPKGTRAKTYSKMQRRESLDRGRMAAATKQLAAKELGLNRQRMGHERLLNLICIISLVNRTSRIRTKRAKRHYKIYIRFFFSSTERGERATTLVKSRNNTRGNIRKA